MDPIKLLNSKFKYKYDSRWFDRWRILDISQEKVEGDCEDYSLTFVYLASDQSLRKFWKNLLLRKFSLHYVKTPRGEGHIVCKHNGLYIDNIQKAFRTKDEYIEKGYKFLFPVPVFLVAAKMLIAQVGKLFP